MKQPENPACRLCGHADLSLLYREDFLEFTPSSAEARTNSFAYLLCARCGLVQVEPTPEPGFLERYYRDSPVAGLDHAILRTVKDRYYQQTIDFLNRLRPERIFEIGAASGYLLHRLAQAFTATVAGMEPSGVSREWALREYGIRLLPGMLDDLDLQAHGLKGAFDLVIACSVLEHTAWPKAFMRKAADLLLQGGHLYLEVPALSRPQGSALTEKVVQPFHLCYYSPAGIMLLGADDGLTCLHVEEIRDLDVPIYRALFKKQPPAALVRELFRTHVQCFDERLHSIIEECGRRIAGASNVWIWGIGDDFFKLWTLSPQTFDPAKCHLVDRSPAKTGKRVGPLAIVAPDEESCGTPDIILIASSSHLIRKNILQDARGLFPHTPIHILYQGEHDDRTR